MRIGKIPYLNLFPYFYWLQHLSQKEYTFVEGVPSEVNSYLRSAKVDISPSSSVEYLRYKNRYHIVPGHSISSKGPVGSILLFSLLPLKELHNQKVCVTYQSETSVVLLKIIARAFLKINPVFQQTRQPINEVLIDSKAYLLIGDEALLVSKTYSTPYVYDLGELWYKHTGLPAVFALWIANENARDRIEEFKEELDRARGWAKDNLEFLASRCGLNTVLTEKELIQYWQGISYSLDEEHMKGLKLFEELFRELNESSQI